MQALVDATRPEKPLVLKALRQQLTKALGPQIGVACTDVDGDPQALWPVEREAILRAIPRRQREFAAGRAAAREAMIQIGWPTEAIPSAPDRSPVWPNGLIGSISHSGGVCIAIAARHNAIHAMGIDVEEYLEIDPTLWASICTPGELANIEAWPKSEQGLQVTRLFCAKEAYYKWQYPQTKQMLDFCDVEVALSRNSTSFRLQPAAPGKTKLLLCGNEGHLLAFNGLLLAWQLGPPAAHD
jgi:enterobactin synthetase component D